MEADINESLDMVNLLRRLRMHGFGLALLLEAHELKLIGKSSDHKPLKDAIFHTDRPAWRKYESFSFRETILVNMIKRYRTVKKKLDHESEHA